MKDKTIKNLDISDKKSEKSDNINEDFQKKTTEPVLNNSNHETYSTILDDSSVQEQLNESALSNSFYTNKELSASFLKKFSSLIKSSYDSKHNYKYYHEQIVSTPDIENEIKDLYNNHYSVVEEKLNEIRAIKKDKESARVKLQPGYFNEQDKASEELINKLLLEIDALEKEKTSLKNSLIFLQSIISKKLEKIKEFIDRSDGFVNSGIDYIDVANRNSDLGNIIDSFNDNNLSKISENNFNLISHISRYTAEADVALHMNTENTCADSIKKIQDFHSSYYNSSNLADSTVGELSTIQVSYNRVTTSENAFEYYSQNILYKKSSFKYEIIHICNT